MSNFNKVVTNIPVSLTETEMSNLSQTFSGIIQGGGGSGEGKRYIGDGVYVTVNNDANPGVISLTQTSLDKLNKEIPSAVSSFPDSIQYAKITDLPDSITDFTDTDTVIYSYINPLTADIQQQINGKQTKLKFDFNDKGEISAIGTNTTTALAGANGITGDYYSASNPSGFINSTQAETQILEKHYLTKASGDLYYLPNPSELIEGTQYAYTTQGWSPIQGGGGASGISFVNHDGTLTGDGNTVKLGVDTTVIQTKLSDAEIQNITDVTTLKTASSTWDNVSAKLNTTDFNTYTATTAPSIYQPIGNYLSSNALEGYATTALLDNVSGELKEQINTKLDKTFSSNFYPMNTNPSGYLTAETDWTNTIQEASAKAYNDATANANSLYQTKGDYVKNTDIGLDANNKVTAISGKELIITAHQSLTNYYTKDETSGATQLSTEFGKYLTKTIADGYYYPLSTNPSNYATSAGLTQSKQYAMTTTGWSEITGGGSTFTGVTTASPITGDGLNNTLGLDSNYKTAIEQVSGKVDKPADMTSNIPYCFSAGQWADITQTYYSKTEATGTFLQKHLTNTLSGDGTTNNTLGVNWSNLSSNLINSANTASNAWISGTEFSSFAQIKTAIDSKQSACDYVHISGDTMTGGLTISAATGNNILTVTSAATQLGASRQTESNFGQNNNAMGTNWIGVDASNRGFFKFVQGGSVGDLNGNSLQMSFSPNTGNGEIVAKCSQNGDRDSVIVNVEQSGYNSMETFDPVNGPNYMLRKTANGFAIGAKVVNVTTLPGTTDANTYYFVYEV